MKGWEVGGGTGLALHLYLWKACTSPWQCWSEVQRGQLPHVSTSERRCGYSDSETWSVPSWSAVTSLGASESYVGAWAFKKELGVIIDGDSTLLKPSSWFLPWPMTSASLKEMGLFLVVHESWQDRMPWLASQTSPKLIILRIQSSSQGSSSWYQLPC